MQEEAWFEIPVPDLSFLILRDLKTQKIQVRIRRPRRGWRMDRKLLVSTNCTLHLGSRLVQEQLNPLLGEIGGI